MAPPLVELMHHAGLHRIAGPVRGLDYRGVMAWNHTNRVSGFQIETVVPFEDPFIVKTEPPFRPRIDFRRDDYFDRSNDGFMKRRKKDPYGLD